MKKTVWITARLLLSVLIIGLLGSCSKCHSPQSRYRVECKFEESRQSFGDPPEQILRVTVRGPAAQLAIIVTNPKGETETGIVSEEEMIDNVESVRFGPGLLWSLDTSEPGTYAIVLKTFDPEKVVHRENFELK